jgi:beta-glucosidase
LARFERRLELVHIAKLVALALLAVAAPVAAQTGSASSPDERAAALEARMTDAERVRLLHSTFARPDRTGKPLPDGAIVSASFTPGIPRLGIPALHETDASLGVAWVNGLRHDGATALPSSLSLASSWDREVARRGSALIAKEARAKGFNVLLAGGVNLAREPRNGRNFEYLGEDPLLAGTLAGETVRAIQAAHMISTVKHFALNAQETGRHVANSRLSDSAAHDSDLLAFKIAIEIGRPGAVMCAYNRYNGPHACQSQYLLSDVLKGEWHFPGFVMSDWGAVRDVRDLLAGLDRQSGEELDDKPYFADDLLAAVQSDRAMHARMRDAVRRMLRSMFAAGLFDDPPKIEPLDVAAGDAVARDAAAAGVVLLKNDGVLPLLRSAQRVAVIGGFAHAGVMSGGGSSQVEPAAGPVITFRPAEARRNIEIHPSPPLVAIKTRLPADARVRFNDGYSPAGAAALAADADVAIVFATQWMSESVDAPDLSLPQGQDAMIAAVAAANPRTIVVLETGGPVLMPWLANVSAVLEAWYPGSSGGEAIADALFGDANPAGRLPISFPASLAQLPRPKLDDTSDPARDVSSQSHALQGFDVDYEIEGADVGYRWLARTRAAPLFPFGYGLSYTRFGYSDLKVIGGDTLRIGFSVTNAGDRAGKDVPQVYVVDRAGTKGLRLVGWGNVSLAPGETRRVEVVADARVLGDWSPRAHAWQVRAGEYVVQVGHASDRADLSGRAALKAKVIR